MEKEVKVEEEKIENAFQNVEFFEPILDKDEKVLKTFKPSKAKMYWSAIFSAFFVSLIFLICIMFMIASAFGEQNGDVVVLTSQSILYGFLIGFCGGLVLVMVLTLIFVSLSYKNTFYAYTNKRVIVRRGIIGVDYKSLDMNMIGIVTVNVSILDKILMKNTGSIQFGSMANPIGGNHLMFGFLHINDPYSVYKEVKNIIDEKKLGKDIEKQ